MCTKQETHDFPTGFTNLLKKITLNKRIWQIWKKTLNLALPTGGSEKTEILKKQLYYWHGLKLLNTQTHAHTHTSTDY